ncbi:hypothetical protein Ccrd_015704 [Cynara cardunculus var. scolymus]|uniref:Uncharacterized protein n=1 Tax=Cynara cardunculus var. scolymus TaxID=59895 RepID=A0A103YBC0_CYNCS|nr:hypothetical protein Ccrd_015704 [Cynara cardunculus var. scolymus]
MGTRLLFIDVGDAFGLLMKQSRGKKITVRERRKLKRTLNDIITLVPIPSPYSSERLNLVRQFKRTKKMEVESWAIEDTSQIRDSTKEGGEDNSFTVAIP